MIIMAVINNALFFDLWACSGSQLLQLFSALGLSV